MILDTHEPAASAVHDLLKCQVYLDSQKLPNNSGLNPGNLGKIKIEKVGVTRIGTRTNVFVVKARKV